jgi:hypothetical protein
VVEGDRKTIWKNWLAVSRNPSLKSARSYSCAIAGEELIQGGVSDVFGRLCVKATLIYGLVFGFTLPAAVVFAVGIPGIPASYILENLWAKDYWLGRREPPKEDTLDIELIRRTING